MEPRIMIYLYKNSILREKHGNYKTKYYSKMITFLVKFMI